MSEIVLPEKGKVVKKGAYKTATLGDVRIADKTTKIGDEAFWCNGTITSVFIPASVEDDRQQRLFDMPQSRKCRDC